MGLSAQPLAELRDGIALRSSLPRRPPSRRVFGRAAMLCVLVCLPLVAGCQYFETARGMSDLAVTTSQFYKLESLVQLDIERRRVPKRGATVRCSPRQRSARPPLTAGSVAAGLMNYSATVHNSRPSCRS